MLIRDVAYSAVPRQRRGEMHQRTAEWLESLSPDRAADRAEMLAHHYLCALELAGETGDQTPQLADRARRALRDAGDRALSLHAFPAAARLFRAALDLWPEKDPYRPWLLFRLGKSIYYAETAGAEVLEEARDGLLAAGDRGAAAEAAAFLLRLAHHRVERDQVAEHLDRVVGLVETLGPTRSKAEVLVDLANYLSIATEHERTITAATEALEIARQLELPELEASALSMIGISRGLSGDAGGRQDLQRSIALTEQTGSHFSVHCCGMLADLERQIGDLPACFGLQARARVHAERFGHAGFVRWLATERVGEAYWTGDWDGALTAADGLIAEADAGVPNFMVGQCRAWRGAIRLARADAAGALSDAELALDFGRAAEDLQMLYPVLAFAARAELVAGSLDRGALLADELLALWNANADAYPASAWSVDLAYALDAVGRGAELVETAATVRAKTRWLDAVVAFASDDLQTAAERFGEIGSLPDQAFARLRGAHALFDAHREDDARIAHEHALAFYRGVDAAAYLGDIVGVAGTTRVTRLHGTNTG